MTKYFVTVTAVGYGKYGDLPTDIMREEVDGDDLEWTLEDIALMGDSAFRDFPTKHLTITVDRI